MASGVGRSKDSAFLKGMGVRPCSIEPMGNTNLTLLLLPLLFSLLLLLLSLLLLGREVTRVGLQTWEDREVSVIGMCAVKFPKNQYKYDVGEDGEKMGRLGIVGFK